MGKRKAEIWTKAETVAAIEAAKKTMTAEYPRAISELQQAQAELHACGKVATGQGEQIVIPEDWYTYRAVLMLRMGYDKLLERQRRPWWKIWKARAK